MSVLVTGACGFIGSHLVKRLREDGEEVISLIHDCPVWTEWLKESVKPTIKVHGDIRDLRFLKRVIVNYEISRIYHLASQSIVRHAIKDPVGTFDVNVMGTIKLLEAARQADADKVLIMSTDKVLGNKEEATEDDPYEPIEPYNGSKICGEIVAKTYMKAYDLDIVMPRSCNAYGYDPSNNRIVPNTVKACLRGEPPAIFLGEETHRQYIYITDLCEALVTLMERGRGVYNVATSDVKTQSEVVHEVLKHFPGLKPRYVRRDRPVEIERQWMVARKLWDWKPRVGFEEGIKLTIGAFRRYGF